MKIKSSLLLCLFALMISFLLSGCHSTPDDTTDPQTPQSQTPSFSASDTLRSTLAICAEIKDSEGRLLATSDGSGVIVSIKDSTAYIVTNCHVIINPAIDEGDPVACESIVAFPYGGSAEHGLCASCLWYSEEYDLALLAVKCIFERFPAAQAIDPSKLDVPSVGERVLLAGNADGAGVAVREGIVSIPYETVSVPVAYSSDRVELRLIRFDALISAGDSGGALFSEDGGLLGILIAKRKDGTGGYAIPSTAVLSITDQLIRRLDAQETPEAFRLHMGTDFEDVHIKTELDADGEISVTVDITVADLTPGSIGSAFLEKGDVITGVRLGDTVYSPKSSGELYEIFLSVVDADSITFEYKRQGENKSYTFTVLSLHTEEIK